MKKYLIGFLSLVSGCALAASVGGGGSVTIVSSGVSASAVSNIVGNYTGAVPVSALAQSMGVPNGAVSMTVSNDGAFIFTVVTNTTSLVVSEVSGDGYNGPPAGTLWTIVGESAGFWYTQEGDGGFQIVGYNHPGIYQLTTSIGLINGAATPEWDCVGPVGGPFVMTATTGGVGALTLRWVPATNYVVMYPMAGGLTTNFVHASAAFSFTNGLLKGYVPAP